MTISRSDETSWKIHAQTINPWSELHNNNIFASISQDNGIKS
jgi:hypothetical protein